MLRNSLFATAFLAASLAPFFASADEAADEAAIRALWDNYASYRVEGDSEAWLGLWDEDGIQMPPGVPARRIEVLRPKLAEAWAANPRDAMAISPEEIVVNGEWAYSRGTYSADAGGNHFEGKFMTILKRQADGSWRIYRDIFNPNG